jgi:hypothetical protein
MDTPSEDLTGAAVFRWADLGPILRVNIRCVYRLRLSVARRFSSVSLTDFAVFGCGARQVQ